MSQSPECKPPWGTLFSLVAVNEKAETAARDKNNQHLLWRGRNGQLALAIGRHNHALPGTIATLGRHQSATIYVPGACISRDQCSIEMHPESKAVMIYDRSSTHTTQVLSQRVEGDERLSPMFLRNRPRRIARFDKFRTIIQMGVPKLGDFLQFQLDWNQDVVTFMEQAKETASSMGVLINPRLAQSVDIVATVIPSLRPTQNLSPDPEESLIRYKKLHTIGSGRHGKVAKAVNLDTGGLMAVKEIVQPSPLSVHERNVKEEIEILSICRHDKIVEYMGMQGWDGPVTQIFMALKEGTLHSLVLETSVKSQLRSMSWAALGHMLEALEFLASKGIIHRDVKPENILYRSKTDGETDGKTDREFPYVFQLCDFSLSSRSNGNVVVKGGSPAFMAPEMTQAIAVETDKVDIWSLFVTVIWALDVGGYRQRGFQKEPENRLAILEARRDADMARIREMATVDAENRPSAAQMRAKILKDVYLPTDASQLAPLCSGPIDPGTVDLEPLPLATPDQIASTSRQTRTQTLRRSTRLCQGRVINPGRRHDSDGTLEGTTVTKKQRR